MNKKRIAMFIKPYKKAIFLLLLIGFFQYMIPLAFPWITKIAIDDVFTGKSEFWTLNKVVMVLAVLYVASVIISYINSIEKAKLSEKVMVDLRVKLYRHMQRLPKKYFDNEKTGNISSTIFYDPMDVSNLIHSGVIALTMNFVLMIMSVVILIKLNVMLTLVSLVVLPLYYILFKRVNGKMRIVWREIAKKRGVVHSNLTEKISGIAVVKTFNQEKMEEKQFVHATENLKNEKVKAEGMINLVQLVTNSFTNLGSLLIWIIGGHFVVKGSMTVGELVAFQAYINSLYGPIRGLSTINVQVQNAFSAIERIEEFFALSTEIQEKETFIELKELKGEVTVKKINFHYEETEHNKTTLKDVSFHAKPGEVIAFVGESGGGKSTIFNLLSRFYQPTSGEILYDGINAEDIKLDSLRKHVGIVLQENVLFSGSVLDNITYGKPNATLDEVIHIAKAVNAHSFIEGLEQGYDTIIGEKGVKLSGGQKQRIAIARTLLTKPSILLLDEATSALDTETESVVVESLEAIAGTCTTFIIAHRLSTVLRADRIYVIEKGEVIETGTHQELLEKKGRYTTLYEKQFFQKENT